MDEYSNYEKNDKIFRIDEYTINVKYIRIWYISIYSLLILGLLFVSWSLHGKVNYSLIYKVYNEISG